ncbi:hypothetical protein AX17_006086 [Amanita inopinata Kibby_2008]|nr:hypothetical protein AX17_006086 [Amanita inopinata Kibby_2008]
MTTTTPKKRSRSHDSADADDPDTKKPRNASPTNPSTPTLEQLTDFSLLTSANQETIQDRFNSIAQAILCDYDLVLGSPASTPTSPSRYQVLELEFYLWMDGSHQDPFTHRSEEQKISQRWYFHRAPQPSTDSTRSSTSLSAYRGGTRKGLDLTIGINGGINANANLSSSSSGVTDIRGGVLLRTLLRLSDKKLISGPSLLVDEILRASSADSITDLVESKWLGDTSAFPPRSSSKTLETYLYFQPRPSPSPPPSKPTFFLAPPPSRPPKIYSSPRIGLELSHCGTTATHTHPRLLFLSRPYRFFLRPELEKGRPQSFLGVLWVCMKERGYGLESLMENGNGSAKVRTAVKAEIVKVMRVKEDVVNKYFGAYVDGLMRGDVREYVGAKGKGASSKPATYLRMVGSLERFLADA